MEAIKSCKSYAARPAGIGLYENGKHVFKVAGHFYFARIGYKRILDFTVFHN